MLRARSGSSSSVKLGEAQAGFKENAHISPLGNRVEIRDASISSILARVRRNCFPGQFVVRERLAMGLWRPHRVWYWRFYRSTSWGDGRDYGLSDTGWLYRRQGYLTEVCFETDPVELGVMNLTWADMPAQTIRIDLRPNVKRHLDILVIFQNNQIRAASLGWPLNRQDFFSRAGNYLFTIVVGGEKTTLPPYRLRLHFTGNWQTSWMQDA
jgi:hypothetical protein